MASRERVKPKGSSSLVLSPFHFFKIILPSSLEGKKLRIPPKFVRKFGHELTDAATFIVPNGSSWQVSVKKDGRRVWFLDGWHEFLESHSIEAGYFLVFKYAKNSRFHVLIFDMTACEISYPYTADESKDYRQNSEFKDDMESEDCVEISEGLFTQKGSKRNFQLATSLENSQVKHKCEPESKKCKKKELAVNNETGDDDEFDLYASLGEMGIYISEKRRSLAEGSRRAVKIARSLKLKSPTFMVIVKPSEIYCGNMYVPAKFAKDFFRRDAKTVKVQVFNGEEKVLHINWRRMGGFFLTKGWAELTKDENLVEGDICVFELIRKEEEDVLLKLSIFHA